MVPLLIMKTLPLKIPTSPQPRKVFSTLMSGKQQIQRLFHQPGQPKFQIKTRKTNTDIISKNNFFWLPRFFSPVSSNHPGLI